MSRFPMVTLELPSWVDDVCGPPDTTYGDLESKARLVITLARINVERGTGGPFGAAVFDLDKNTLIAPGVNLVVPAASAVAHAEIVAVAVAGAVLGDFDLGSRGRTSLVTSTEPCAMCFGSVPWSGVSELVCCARDEDARQVGFDEGPKMEDWVTPLTRRGIDVISDVERPAAAAVLRSYADGGGPIYNSARES